jgi:excisionase family DNA binding protein
MKNLPEKHVSVTQAAVICGVGRTTIGYWIRSGKVRATRVGHNYAIPAGELIYYMKSTGQRVPKELLKLESDHRYFRPFYNCWEYQRGTAHGEHCKDCRVFEHQITPCFTARGSVGVGCGELCSECSFYNDIFSPRLQLVHQFHQPAAIIKNLDIWAGNQALADLCGLTVNDLIGVGIEQIVHNESLTFAISEFKRLGMNGLSRAEEYSLKLKGKKKAIDVDLSVHPLTEPERSFILLGKTG